MKSIFLAQTELKAKLDQARPVVIALSGGVDSVVLAHMANKIRNPGQMLYAIHVHHGLSKNADDWADFLTTLCQSMNIHLTVCRVSLNKKPGDSLEDVARKARYEALFDKSPEAAQILLGHHLDDQLETMLIALKRGSGALRLRGMAPSSIDDSGKTLLRPLLDVPKAEILEFAIANEFQWIEDESNQDSCFDRNFLRNEVIPMLKNRWNGLLTATKRTARILRDENEIVEIHAKQVLASTVDENGDMLVEALSKLAPVEIRLAVRHWIISKGTAAPREDKTMNIYLEVAMAKQGQQPAFKIAGGKIIRHKKVMKFIPE
jgi:tRNA(Ile)-lysidine synthase